MKGPKQRVTLFVTLPEQGVSPASPDGRGDSREKVRSEDQTAVRVNQPHLHN